MTNFHPITVELALTDEQLAEIHAYQERTGESFQAATRQFFYRLLYIHDMAKKQ